mgnify:CR=1 FL=1
MVVIHWSNRLSGAPVQGAFTRHDVGAFSSVTGLVLKTTSSLPHIKRKRRIVSQGAARTPASHMSALHLTSRPLYFNPRSAPYWRRVGTPSCSSVGPVTSRRAAPSCPRHKPARNPSMAPGPEPEPAYTAEPGVLEQEEEEEREGAGARAAAWGLRR